jgi:hypothetical protein
MPCEVVPLSVDFFKMAAVAMETVKMLREDSAGQNCAESGIIRIIIIRRRRRNRAKVICLTNYVWEP